LNVKNHLAAKRVFSPRQLLTLGYLSGRSGHSGTPSRGSRWKPDTLERWWQGTHLPLFHLQKKQAAGTLTCKSLYPACNFPV